MQMLVMSLVAQFLCRRGQRLNGLRRNRREMGRGQLGQGREQGQDQGQDQGCYVHRNSYLIFIEQHHA